MTLWTVACQVPMSMGFSRQKYWSGLPCPPPGDLPDPGIEPASLTSLALASRFFTTSTTCVCAKLLQLWSDYSAMPWTIAHRAPLSMRFSRQEYWSGLLCTPPGDLPNPGIEPASLTSLALAGRFFTSCTTWEAQLLN